MALVRVSDAVVAETEARSAQGVRSLCFPQMAPAGAHPEFVRRHGITVCSARFTVPLTTKGAGQMRENPM